MNRQLSYRLSLHTKIIGLIISLFFIRIEFSSAQKALISKKEFFTGSGVIEMTLVADYKKLIREKLKKDFDQNYQPAAITCVFPGNIKVTEEVEIRARGHLQERRVSYATFDGQFQDLPIGCIEKFRPVKISLALWQW